MVVAGFSRHDGQVTARETERSAFEQQAIRDDFGIDNPRWRHYVSRAHRAALKTVNGSYLRQLRARKLRGAPLAGPGAEQAVADVAAQAQPAGAATRPIDRLMLLATWFHGDTADIRGEYAQMRGDSTSLRHWEVYLDCIDLFLASARRWDDDLRLAVVLNPAAAEALTPERRTLWEASGATVLVAENRHRAPADFHGLWQNQFYVLDCLRVLAEAAAAGESVVLADSDCLVTRPLTDLDAVVQEHGRAFYAVPFPPDVAVNDLTRRDLADLAAELHGEAVDDALPYLGGEFLAFRADTLPGELKRLDAAFEWSVERAGLGLPHPNEEAQLISVTLGPTLAPEQLQARAVRRVWTQPWNLRNAGPADLDVAIWHLPAEKRTGLTRVHRAYEDPDSWFWQAPREAWLRTAGRLVGVPGYGAVKAVTDAVALAPRLVPGVRRRLAMRGGSTDERALLGRAPSGGLTQWHRPWSGGFPGA